MPGRGKSLVQYIYLEYKEWFDAKRNNHPVETLWPSAEYKFSKGRNAKFNLYIEQHYQLTNQGKMTELASPFMLQGLLQCSGYGTEARFPKAASGFACAKAFTFMMQNISWLPFPCFGYLNCQRARMYIKVSRSSFMSTCMKTVEQSFQGDSYSREGRLHRPRQTGSPQEAGVGSSPHKH